MPKVKIVNNLALDVYMKAEERFICGSATKADEVLLALWDETKAQAETIREMALKISLLETVENGNVNSLECLSFLERMGRNVKFENI